MLRAICSAAQVDSLVTLEFGVFSATFALLGYFRGPLRLVRQPDTSGETPGRCKTVPPAEVMPRIARPSAGLISAPDAAPLRARTEKNCAKRRSEGFRNIEFHFPPPNALHTTRIAACCSLLADSGRYSLPKPQLLQERLRRERNLSGDAFFSSRKRRRMRSFFSSKCCCCIFSPFSTSRAAAQLPGDAGNLGIQRAWSPTSGISV
jgi:hypothetical protein